jgi:peptidoglycan-N-acetylglucosamine deacetylase
MAVMITFGLLVAMTGGTASFGSTAQLVRSPMARRTTSRRFAPGSEINAPASSGSAPATRGRATQVGPTLALPKDPVLIYGGSTTARKIALTLDAGSDRGNAEGILDLLKARGLHVTFGMTGRWASLNPDLVKRMADEGHTFINHTYSHDSLTGFATKRPPMTAEQIRFELAATEMTIQQISGATTKPYFRPPYMDMDPYSRAVIAGEGYPFIIMQTVDSRGWQGLAPPLVVQRCLDGASPGGIYVMHVGSQSTDFAALPAVIDGLIADGYEITTVAGVLTPS